MDTMNELLQKAEDYRPAQRDSSAASQRTTLVARGKAKSHTKRTQSTHVAELGSGRTVTFTGGDLTLDGLIEQLEELLGKARKLRPQQLSLATFLMILRDQAGA